MKSFLSKSFQLIPETKRKKLPLFFLYSLLNTLLDFISIVYLVPLILILLDKNKLEKWVFSYLKMQLDTKLIGFLVVTLVLFYILKNWIQTSIIKKQSNFIYDISASISQQLMTLFVAQPYKKYTNNDKNVFFRDIFQLPLTFASSILFSLYIIFSECIILMILVIVGLFFNPIFTVLSLILLFGLTYVLLLMQKKKVDLLNQSIVALYQENVKNIQNIFQGFVEIKTTQSQNEFITKFNQTNQKSNQELASLNAFKQSTGRYFEILFVIALSLVTLFFVMSKNGFSQLVLFSFFAGASIKILPSFNKIMNAILDIKANREVVSILSIHQAEMPNPESKIIFSESILLQNIDFEFGNKTILKSINLEINKGGFIVISGNSGDGKSTLLQLIAGLQKPKNGAITVNDELIKTKDFSFENIGYVSQQPFLFQGSILENITMLQEKIDLKKVEDIINALDLSDWIKSLPEGLHSELLLESKQLSGGQKQRLALARILYFGSKLLLLDEATNQLDEATELKILTYLKNSNLTIVAVSHSEKINEFATKKYTLTKGNLDKNG